MKRWLEVLTAVAAILATSGVLIGGVRWAVDPLREDVQALRAEVRSDIGELRAEVRAEISGLRSEVRAEIGGLRSEVGGLRAEVVDIRERLVRVEEAVKRLEAGQEARRRQGGAETSGTVGAAGG